jgi:hypothetical protein
LSLRASWAGTISLVTRPSSAVASSMMSKDASMLSGVSMTMVYYGHAAGELK